MTSKISFVVAITGAALVLAGPAWGDPWAADQYAGTVRVSPDLVDRAIAARQNELATILDARERAQGTRPGLVAPDPVHDDHFRTDPSSTATPVATSGSGRDVQWSQVGIGFGLGVLLVTGLLLVLRIPRIRQPAH
jgi:hypothetical protein